MRDLTDAELREAELDLMSPLVRAEAEVRGKLNIALRPFVGQPATEQNRLAVESAVRAVFGPPVTVGVDGATRTFRVTFE